MTTYICTLYYPPWFLPHWCFGAKAPTATVGGTQDPSHSALLPSEPIKRPRQHSIAIQATPTLFAFSREKGSTGRGGEGEGLHKYSLQPISWCPVFIFFCTRNHVYIFIHLQKYWPPIQIYTYTHIHTHIYIYTYMYTPSYIYTCLRTYVHTHTYIYAYIQPL